MAGQRVGGIGEKKKAPTSPTKAGTSWSNDDIRTCLAPDFVRFDQKTQRRTSKKWSKPVQLSGEEYEITAWGRQVKRTRIFVNLGVVGKKIGRLCGVTRGFVKVGNL
jgi:hypothetical protein